MLTLTTPAVVFSTISLLLLAYTNRFTALASVIRDLHNKKKVEEKININIIDPQIDSLKKRVHIIKNMQFYAILSSKLPVWAFSPVRKPACCRAFVRFIIF